MKLEMITNQYLSITSINTTKTFELQIKKIIDNQYNQSSKYLVWCIKKIKTNNMSFIIN